MKHIIIWLFVFLLCSMVFSEPGSVWSRLSVHQSQRSLHICIVVLLLFWERFKPTGVFDAKKKSLSLGSNFSNSWGNLQWINNVVVLYRHPLTSTFADKSSFFPSRMTTPANCMSFYIYILRNDSLSPQPVTLFIFICHSGNLFISSLPAL